MSLLDRYLAAVGNHLPADQRDDILAELGDDFRARFDDRAAALGRPLTEAEEAELLKPYGRPLLLASRYRPRQHLIGPDLFPYYWSTLKVAFPIAFLVFVAIATSFIVAGRPMRDVIDLFARGAVDAALSVFTWVTLVFAMLDLGAGRVKAWDDWDPRSLPHDTRPAGPVSRFELVAELVLSTVFLAWWTTMPHSRWLQSLGNSGLELAPAWGAFYLPVLLVVLASMAAKAVTLVRPDLATFRFAASLVTTVAGITILGMLLGAGDLVVANRPDQNLARLADVVNMSLRISFFVAIVVNVVTTALDAWRYARRRRVRFA